MPILNFGSLNLDHVYSVEHFVRPGETVSSQDMQSFPGGKGLNQSVALAKAGARVFHAGCVGQDGALLTDTLAQSGVDTRLIHQVSIPTGHAVIQVDETGQNCILLYGGANRAIGPEQIRQTLLDFSREAGEPALVLLQNEISGLPRILELCRRLGLPTALNPSPITSDLPGLPLGEVTWLILNELEAQALLGDSSCTGVSEESIGKMLIGALAQRYPRTNLVLTLGDQGALCRLAGTDNGILYQPIFPVNAVDTTAAGDTFTGYFLQGIYSGRTPAQALEWASAASALAVSRHGAAPSIPTALEVREFLQRRG